MKFLGFFIDRSNWQYLPRIDKEPKGSFFMRGGDKYGEGSGFKSEQ